MAISLPSIPERMRWMSAFSLGVLVLATIVAMSTGGGAPTFAPAASASGAVADPSVGSSLSAAAAEQPGERVQVIVRMAAGVSPAVGRGLVGDADGKVTSRDLPIINGFGAEMSAGDAKALGSDPRVRAVSLNGAVEPRDNRDNDDDRGDSRYDFLSSVYEAAEHPRTYELPAGCPDADASTFSLAQWPLRSRDNLAKPRKSLSRISGVQHHAVAADRAWSHATGKGVGVAVIDTGIAGDLPDFRRRSNSRESRVVASAVTNPCAKEATDNYGHGTHVAGLIAGNSMALQSDDSRYSRNMGIAPGADLISVKVSDEDGNANVLDVIYGLQFAVDHKDEHNIRVINLSLSSTVAESYLTDPLDAAVEQAWNAGLVVVTAAGNEGTQEDAVAYSPANDPYVISVGAVNDRNTRTVLDDLLAPWSSRGRTQDGVRKPEVLAPGTSLTATVAPNSDITKMCPSCISGNGRYFRMGGTSMSAAIVSGGVALILEEHPGWTPNQVKGALMQTLFNVPGVGGEVNVHDAMHAKPVAANEGLEPAGIIDPTTGMIDWSRASFRRASFRSASDSRLGASWSRASFRCNCSLTDNGDEVDPARASFRRASFRKTADVDK